MLGAPYHYLAPTRWGAFVRAGSGGDWEKLGEFPTSHEAQSAAVDAIRTRFTDGSKLEYAVTANGLAPLASDPVFVVISPTGIYRPQDANTSQFHTLGSGVAPTQGKGPLGQPGCYREQGATGTQPYGREAQPTREEYQQIVRYASENHISFDRALACFSTAHRERYQQQQSGLPSRDEREKFRMQRAQSEIELSRYQRSGVELSAVQSATPLTSAEEAAFAVKLATVRSCSFDEALKIVRKG